MGVSYGNQMCLLLILSLAFMVAFQACIMQWTVVIVIIWVAEKA